MNSTIPNIELISEIDSRIQFTKKINNKIIRNKHILIVCYNIKQSMYEYIPLLEYLGFKINVSLLKGEIIYNDTKIKFITYDTDYKYIKGMYIDEVIYE